MYYFYILRCKDNSLYCGQTKNIEKRVEEHNTHSKKTAKYTRGRRPVRLVYFEKYETLSDVLKREYEVKQWNKKKKEALVNGV